MNNSQRKLLFAMAGLIVLMTIYPPYERKFPNGFVDKTGFDFIFAMPRWEHDMPVASVNIAQLLAQIAAVALAGGLVCLALQDKKK